jgi:two-component system phosphate regulon sensor histidine kinase PhoR
MRAFWYFLGLAVVVPLGWLVWHTVRQMRAVSALSRAVSAEPELPPVPVTVELGAVHAAVERMAEVMHRRLVRARTEERRLETVLNGMVEGVLVIDANDIVLLSNRRAQELLELPPEEECVGRPLIELTRYPDIHALLRHVKDQGDTQRTLIEEMVLKGGRQNTLQVSATRLLNEAEEGTNAFILVFHDVSELKHLERVRRDFVANVSHELRTPLAAIRGYSETLLTSALEDPEASRRFLAIIERHAERLGRLVDDLLTLSDLELGRTALQRTAVDVRELVDRVFEVLREPAQRGNILLTQDLSEDTPLLDADPDRAEQALLNLVDNAIKYTSAKGTVAVRARLLPGHEGGRNLVELAVVDSGIGVPTADLERLTERFYRVDKARSRQLGGTGLGLAIVKHIAQAHGGSLRIESEVNRGTTVYLCLPAAEPARTGFAA